MTYRQGSFSLDIKAFAERAGANADFVAKKAIFDLMTEVVTRTPVDIGRLRGNWQVGINDAPQYSLDTVDPDGGPTLAAGLAQINRGNFGDDFYIINNLVYAIPIEYGHSRVKAPQGMVRVSLASFHNFVESATDHPKRNPLK